MALGRTDDTEVLPAEAERMLADMKWGGAPAERIEQMRAQLVGQVRDEDFLVHPANIPAVKVFLGMQTQWRWLGTMTRAVRVGLDYSVLPVVAQAEGYAPFEGHDFTRLRVLEAEALSAWTERK
ncbi:DUF1799 domain-containing protein [Phenylobacterium sp. 58.2.17]|uniref:DUF1799 domain-containing protein n=1 Tax=Phenylobacterium sp. 58.2.17 TaxID=2969306 RepID=UPI0022646481|nr:DUF1799 domain-containing protein [Phenylobacterium sp. 58.2.17]MCX7586538.1 DUF1799 domain-containing protein [Phenylobacterium sp. 58.2.17]